MKLGRNFHLFSTDFQPVYWCPAVKFCFKLVVFRWNRPLSTIVSSSSLDRASNRLKVSISLTDCDETRLANAHPPVFPSPNPFERHPFKQLNSLEGCEMWLKYSKILTRIQANIHIIDDETFPNGLSSTRIRWAINSKPPIPYTNQQLFIVFFNFLLRIEEI